jgi:hypothetical protein
MSDPTSPPLDVQIECVKREIGMRKHVYPKWVAAERMSEGKAARELAAMEAVLETLQGLRDAALKAAP